MYRQVWYIQQTVHISTQPSKHSTESRSPTVHPAYYRWAEQMSANVWRRTKTRKANTSQNLLLLLNASEPSHKRSWPQQSRALTCDWTSKKARTSLDVATSNWLQGEGKQNTDHVAPRQSKVISLQRLLAGRTFSQISNNNGRHCSSAEEISEHQRPHEGKKGKEGRRRLLVTHSQSSPKWPK